jgi:hypothetical protein
MTFTINIVLKVELLIYTDESFFYDFKIIIPAFSSRSALSRMRKFEILL